MSLIWQNQSIIETNVSIIWQKSSDPLSKCEHNLAKNQLNIKTNVSPIWQKCIRMRLFWLVFNHCGDDHECMRIEYE